MKIKNIFNPQDIIEFCAGIGKYRSYRYSNRVMLFAGDIVPRLNQDYVYEIFVINGEVLIVPRDENGAPTSAAMVVDFSNCPDDYYNVRESEYALYGDVLVNIVIENCYSVDKALPEWAQTTHPSKINVSTDDLWNSFEEYLSSLCPNFSLVETKKKYRREKEWGCVTIHSATDSGDGEKKSQISAVSLIS
ncbi:hypothetical protein IKG50_03020 [Candidatus Saccharibacteria bacterium]|nr:hypothetical protein [Candidatus Saccharibacteria bacterium]